MSRSNLRAIITVMSSVAQTKAPPHARILVVDDEALITGALTRALTSLGYDVAAASTGHEALTALQSWPRDVMVLDLALPDMSGVEVMARAAQVCPGLLVIVLTGQAELDDAIAAVKYHAVDFLLKPAAIEQITEAVVTALRGQARRLQERVALRILDEAIDALQGIDRRPRVVRTAPPAPMLHVPPLLLDRQEQTVVVAGDNPHTCKLTQGEVDVLAALMARPGQPLSAQELAAAGLGVQEDEKVMRGAIVHCISRLRSKLETDPDQPRLIRTIRGAGYQFEPAR